MGNEAQLPLCNILKSEEVLYMQTERSSGIVIIPLLACVLFVCLLLVRLHGGKHMEQNAVKDVKCLI